MCKENGGCRKVIVCLLLLDVECSFGFLMIFWIFIIFKIFGFLRVPGGAQGPPPFIKRLALILFTPGAPGFVICFFLLFVFFFFFY